MSVFLPGIYLAALLVGTFLISLLLKNQRNRTASILLSLLITSLMLTLWNGAVLILDIPPYLKVSILDYYLYASTYFWGPLLYFYTLSITGIEAINRSLIVRHISFPIIVTLSQVAIATWGYFPHFNIIAVILAFSYLGIYIYMSHLKLKRHQERVKQTFSQIEELQLAWLGKLIAIFVFVLSVDLSLSLALAFRKLDYAPIMGMIILLESSTIFAIGYFSLKQPEIFFPPLEKEEARNGKKKYDNSALDDQLAKSLADQLLKLMEEDQPYKRNDLKLGDLADLMGLSNHHLSQVINDQVGCNFYEFVNQYRIEYAAKLMQENALANITRLAFDAGFNNRVSFTKAFKKQLGQTPSAYLKSTSAQTANIY